MIIKFYADIFIILFYFLFIIYNKLLHIYIKNQKNNKKVENQKKR